MPTFTARGNTNMGSVSTRGSACRFSLNGQPFRLSFFRLTFTDVTSGGTADSSATTTLKVDNLRETWRRRTVLTATATGITTGSDFAFTSEKPNDGRYIFDGNDELVFERTADDVGNTEWLLEVGLDAVV